MAKPASHKPTHRLVAQVVSKQTPPLVAQLEDLETTKEIALQNNEDKEEKNRMESLMDNVQVKAWWQYEDDVTKLMDNVQVQPLWQYEDHVTKYNVKDIELGMNKEINQMINKKSFTE
eukprot:1062694-Amphidinium_carterae.1